MSPRPANFATLGNVLALAKRPNVAAKVSAMPCYADDKTYPFRSAHPHIQRVFDAFGPKRTFWGTDLSRLPCSYKQGVTMFTEEMPWLKGDDLEGVRGRGVCDWLGWKIWIERPCGLSCMLSAARSHDQYAGVWSPVRPAALRTT